MVSCDPTRAIISYDQLKGDEMKLLHVISGLAVLTTLAFVIVPLFALANDTYQKQAEISLRIAERRTEFAQHHYTAQCEIVHYAHNQLGWKDGEFEISFRSEARGALYFGLNHISSAEDFERGTIDPNNSFTMLVDKKTNKIIGVYR